jgi:hypothetical protein
MTFRKRGKDTEKERYKVDMNECIKKLWDQKTTLISKNVKEINTQIISNKHMPIGYDKILKHVSGES